MGILIKEFMGLSGAQHLVSTYYMPGTLLNTTDIIWLYFTATFIIATHIGITEA